MMSPGSQGASAQTPIHAQRSTEAPCQHPASAEYRRRKTIGKLWAIVKYTLLREHGAGCDDGISTGVANLHGRLPAAGGGFSDSMVDGSDDWAGTLRRWITWELLVQQISMIEPAGS